MGYGKKIVLSYKDNLIAADNCNANPNPNPTSRTKIRRVFFQILFVSPDIALTRSATWTNFQLVFPSFPDRVCFSWEERIPTPTSRPGRRRSTASTASRPTTRCASSLSLARSLFLHLSFSLSISLSLCPFNSLQTLTDLTFILQVTLLCIWTLISF